jgi:hypothetical protein
MLLKLDALEALARIRQSVVCGCESCLKPFDIIKKALTSIPEGPPALIEEPHISCFYSAVPNKAIPLSQARSNYNVRSQICESCKACQNDIR